MVCVCTQVVAAGNISAICQEKMHAPCKHVFCEDCVSEWFPSERTSPLCRALIALQSLFTDLSILTYFASENAVGLQHEEYHTFGVDLQELGGF